MTFEEYVNEWHRLQKEVEQLNAKLKPIKDAELAMRKGIAEQLKNYIGEDKLNVGVNKVTIGDHDFKYTYKVKRTIDESGITLAREAWDAANNRPNHLGFDDMLRTKFELNAKPYKDLTGEAKLALSHMIVSKDESPILEIIE